MKGNPGPMSMRQNSLFWKNFLKVSLTSKIKIFL